MRHTARAFMMMLASAAAAAAQEDYRHGRIRDVEPTVTLQREAEPGAEEAAPNSPFLPGDRVWTDGRGRAEFQFPDGAILRLDRRGKLDYLTHDESRGERVVLKLWSGGLYLRTRGGAAVEIETPAGIVETHDRGTYRIDVDSGETRLSVYEGEAVLDGAGRRQDVAAEERAYLRRGEEPERPQSFDRRAEDEFSAWDRDRQSRETFVDGGRRYLPQELDAYSGELEANGAWRYEASVGNVWQPYVEQGWQPYTNGRWCWTSYGWTWVPSERWGWAPFHYGRWGQSASFGWYWIPGRSWGPAWVSWASGGNYVGWCPLGWRDRPVHGWGGTAGVAVNRGTGRNAWNFVRRGDMGARDLSRRRLDTTVADLQQVRVVESPGARPSRDLREFGVAGPRGVRAVPRGARIGPTPGDTVPELRVDRQTLPLGAGPRPRYDERDANRGDVRRGLREAPPSNRPQTGEERATDVRSPRSRPAQPTENPTGAEIRRTEPRRPAPPRLAPAERDADHDVLGRFFRPLSEPRPRPRSDKDAATPTTPPSREDRSEPRRDEERSRPRSEASEGRGERGDGGSPRGVRSAPREERTPPARVETRRSEPSQPAPRTERTEHAAPRTEHAAPRPQKQERNRN